MCRFVGRWWHPVRSHAPAAVLGGPMKRARSWLLLCGLHGVLSMLFWWADPALLEAMTWRPELSVLQPWRLWTSAWVHVNTPQLIINQVALGALAALAWVSRPGWRSGLAWCLCWPLVPLCLLAWPQIGYGAGLAGLLHAGLVLLGLQLCFGRSPIPKARRWGLMLLAAVALKLWVEAGWREPVVWHTGYEMSVLQAAHFSGAVLGLVFGLCLLWWRWWAGPQPTA